MKETMERKIDGIEKDGTETKMNTGNYKKQK